eukprot:TRINITY_DN2259_c0_g1_i1.p1 TRINITY_DN2259_c0_g1~~TRINITY_DN2259_c0_g1_i1.p1  ORF type:complete len:1030 (-),score=301.04 TRINITY_DN2259_c0_g1_i1:31-3120(-)
MSNFLNKLTKKKDKPNEVIEEDMNSGILPKTQVTPQLKTEFRICDTTKDCLEEISKKLKEINKIKTKLNEEVMGFAKILENFSHQMEQQNQPISGQIMKIAEFYLKSYSMNAKLEDDTNSQFITPISEILNGTINEAEYSRKKIMEVLKQCDNINKKVEKAQKGERNKLMEIVNEQGECKMKKETIEQQTLLTFKDVNVRNELQMIELFETILNLNSDYHKELSSSADTCFENIEKYSIYRTKKRDLHESGQSVEGLTLETAQTQDFQHKIKPVDNIHSCLLDMTNNERTYVKLLGTVIKSFMNNVQTYENLSETKVGQSDINEIFSNIKQLYSFHKQFLESLQTQAQTYPNKITIGEEIQAFTPKLKAYNYYLSHYSKAMNTLDLASKRPHFKKFLQSIGSKKSLRDLLSAPLDRISNYMISFKKLNEACPSNHPLSKYAFEAINFLNTEAGEFSKSSQTSFNIGTVLPLWNILSGYPGELLVNHRTLVHKGTLSRITETPEKTSKEDFVYCLFSDMLIEAKKKSVLSRLGKDGDKIDFVSEIPIMNIKLIPLPDTEQIQNAMFLTFGNNEGFKLACDSPQDRNEWVVAVNKANNKANTNKIFGVQLSDVMKIGDNVGLDIPIILSVTVSYVMKYGLESEGIFRKSGSKTEIERICDMFNNGAHVVIENYTTDEHTGAGVLKQWFRSLTEPICTFALYEEFVAAHSEYNLDINYLKSVVKKLPKANLYSLQHLLKCLSEVTKRSNLNKMTTMNLAIVFGPNSISKEGASPFDTSGYENVYSVFACLVDKYDEIFSEIEQERQKRSQLTSSFERPILETLHVSTINNNNNNNNNTNNNDYNNYNNFNTSPSTLVSSSPPNLQPPILPIRPSPKKTIGKGEFVKMLPKKGPSKTFSSLKKPLPKTDNDQEYDTSNSESEEMSGEGRSGLSKSRQSRYSVAVTENDILNFNKGSLNTSSNSITYNINNLSNSSPSNTISTSSPLPPPSYRVAPNSNPPPNPFANPPVNSPLKSVKRPLPGVKTPPNDFNNN